MDDERIIGLYWDRKEQAITETSSKYGSLCFRIANNILASHEDSEECVNDTYLSVWNNIPSNRPERFSAYIAKITRNLALTRYDYVSAKKRNPDAVCSLDELGDCVSGRETVESTIENRRIEEAINSFLWRQTKEKRDVFILRYWYFESLQDICQRTGFSLSKVKSMLFDLRRKLRDYLESEGVEL